MSCDCFKWSRWLELGKTLPNNLMIALKDKYISPFTDFGFKKLFGTELNKDLLLDFLNDLLRKATRNNQRRLLRIAI